MRVMRAIHRDLRNIALLALLGFLTTLPSAYLSPMVVPTDAPASVKYYAALTDYNTLKLVAVRFVQTPSTTSSEARKVLALVEATDKRIKQVAAAYTQGAMTTGRFELASAMLRQVTNELRALAVKEE